MGLRRQVDVKEVSSSGMRTLPEHKHRLFHLKTPNAGLGKRLQKRYSVQVALLRPRVFLDT